MPPASPVPGWSSGEVCRLIIASRRRARPRAPPCTLGRPDFPRDNHRAAGLDSRGDLGPPAQRGVRPPRTARLASRSSSGLVRAPRSADDAVERDQRRPRTAVDRRGRSYCRVQEREHRPRRAASEAESRRPARSQRRAGHQARSRCRRARRRAGRGRPSSRRVDQRPSRTVAVVDGSPGRPSTGRRATPAMRASGGGIVAPPPEVMCGPPHMCRPVRRRAAPEWPA